MNTKPMTDAVWVLEGRRPALEVAIVEAGGRLVRWDDAWWGNDGWPDLSGGPVVFHGSASNAEEIRRALRRWRPGAFCDSAAFQFSSWRRRAKRWLVQGPAVVGRRWRYVVAERAVVAGAEGEPRVFAAEIAARLKPPEEVYVMDVGEVDGALRLVEISTFSNADLEGCACPSMVVAVSAAAARAWSARSNGA